MKTEYEATFKQVNKDELRVLLKKNNAVLVKPEFLQVRKTFWISENSFLRVRKEGDKNTMTLKTFSEDNNIESQKELEVEVGDFDNTIEILKKLGVKEKSFQETKRELWKTGEVEVMIDTWPFLETFVEIEGKNELDVKNISEKLGFKWQDAYFCPVTDLYSEKYNISKDRINNKTPKIVFDMENPFL